MELRAHCCNKHLFSILPYHNYENTHIPIYLLEKIYLFRKSPETDILALPHPPLGFQ